MLDQRIQLRVQRMFDAGFVDEVRHLLDHGLREARTASRALGYPQMIDLHRWTHGSSIRRGRTS